jgi:actin
MVGMGHKDSYVGDEAQSKRGMLRLSHPIEHSCVASVDDYEKVLHHTFYDELRVAPEEHPCLFVEPPLTSKSSREKLLQIMFETFSNPATALVNSGVLALYANHRVNGVVLDIGGGCTNVVPVLDGRSVPHAIERVDVAGVDLTDYLTHLMAQKYPFLTTAEHEITDDCKQKLCFVAQDFDRESSTSMPKTYVCSNALTGALKTRYCRYELPDCQVVTADGERCRVGEALFKPRLMGEWAPSHGVHEVIARAVGACDLERRKLLLSNVVVAGGSTLLPGFCSRLTKVRRSAL